MAKMRNAAARRVPRTGVARQARAAAPMARQNGPAEGARAKKSASRREAILAAALEEFSAHGFEAARLDDMARRAGVAKGTIYLYFKDKEELFQALVRSFISPVVGALEQVSHVDAPLPAVVRELAELFVREIVETRRRDIIRLIFSEGQRFPKLAEFYYREVISRALVAVRALLKRALERGEISNEALVRFPQLLVAPGLVAIIWKSLFDRIDPLDVRAMLHAHFEFILTRAK